MPRIPLSSLNLLRAFEAAGRLMSFRDAGKELHVTPAAVSQQVRLLEDELGLSLFIRVHRGLRFTEAGEQYWQEVHEHLDALGRSTVALLRRQGCTVLRVSLMPPVATRIVLPALAGFHDRHPDVELRLDSSLRNVDLSALEADVAVRFGVPPWAGCQHRKLVDVYVVPVCPPRMAERFQLGDDPKQLARMPLIHMTSRPKTWAEFFARTGLGPPRPEREYHVDDYPAAIEAAEHLGAALAMVPPEQPLLDSARVVAPLGRFGPVTEAIFAVWPERTEAREATAAFIEWLAERFDAVEQKH